ncbi:UNKNOWN [Stylonychia lemnae]|uniref:Amino acid transporter transmembrane domain-containing protein n=1 Tax=Stylonychia lemnae TaxID=5949 RepID=A0A077ZUJ2_STYLE|nr:UNKNOWN [Stylonychia lemnae]|eukprot:CDW73229.1 UNKNOWN [Stylonychia lemnae]
MEKQNKESKLETISSNEQQEHERTSLISNSDIGENYRAITETSYFSTRHLTNEDKLLRTSTHYYSLLNIFKGYIGISFLAIPQGFAQVGLYGATIELILIMILNLYSVYLLVKARNKYKRQPIRNICDLCEQIFGPRAKNAANILLIITEIQFCVSYTIYFGEQLDQLFCQILPITSCGKKYLYRLLFSIAILPLMYMKQLRKIAVFSFFSNVATIVAIILIILVEINIIQNQPPQTVQYENLKIIDIWQMPIYFGVAMCLYEGNGLILNLYSEVDKPHKFMNQISLVLSLLTGLGIIVGALSYMAFGGKIESIILQNLPNNAIGISIKLMYMITITGIYVLVIYPVFQIMEDDHKYKNIARIGENTKFFLFRTLIIALILGFSMLIPNITVMLSIVGSISGTLISVIVPAVMYNTAYKDSEKKSFRRKMNVIFMIIGSVFGTIGFYESIRAIIFPKDE